MLAQSSLPLSVNTKFITHSQTFVTDGDSDTPGKPEEARVGLGWFGIGSGVGAVSGICMSARNVRTAVKVIHISGAAAFAFFTFFSSSFFWHFLFFFFFTCVAINFLLRRVAN